jgi:hypothetical protein
MPSRKGGLFSLRESAFDRPPIRLAKLSPTNRDIRDESELGRVFGQLGDQPRDEVLGRIDHDYDVDVHLRVAEWSTPAFVDT